jgi:putative transcriptional regulator
MFVFMVGYTYVKEKVINNNIQELRLALNLTQIELAEAVGVTRQTIIAIEKGSYTPSLSLAFSFARFFNKPLTTLFWES